jgi:hypothetical protein
MEATEPKKTPKIKVKHVCGHVAVYETTLQTPQERAAERDRMAKMKCRDCWSAERDEERHQRRIEAASINAKKGLPPLTYKSDAQRLWAEEVRLQKADSIEAFLRAAGPDDLPRLPGMTVSEAKQATLAAARAILRQTSASWWIDQRKNAVKAILLTKMLARQNRPAQQHTRGGVFSDSDLQLIG